MVGFVSQLTVEENLNNDNTQPSKIRTLNDPAGPLPDPFLDFDSLKEWFEVDNTNPDSFSLGDIEFDDLEKCIAAMGDDHEQLASETNGEKVISNQPAQVPELTVKEGGRELEGKLDCSIEQEMEKVSLVSPSASGSTNVDGTHVREKIVTDKEESSESSEESESESESSSSSDSSSDSEAENEGLEKNEKMKKQSVEVGDMEEGEINSDGGDDVAVLRNQNDVEQEDADKMVSWTDDDSEEESVTKLYGVSDTELHDLDEEDEDEDGVVRPIVSKNELQDLPHVPLVNVTLEPHHQPLPVGVVLSILGPKVVVEGAEKHNPLNEGSILWVTESRSPLGLIDEIFGPVKNPYYVVRYNSENEIPAGIKEGTLVSFVQEFAGHVLNDKNLYKKGYDGSGENDEEVSDEEFFSDDEKEAEYRRMQKTNKRGSNDQTTNNRKNRNRRKNRPGQLSPNPNQSQGATSQAGNNSGPPSDNVPPGFGNTTPSFSPFPPTGPAFPPGAMPAFQQPQNGVFPQGFPNMPLPIFMPFPMPFNPSQAPFPNPNFFPGGPPNFFPPPNAQWRTPDQNMQHQMGPQQHGQVRTVVTPFPDGFRVTPTHDGNNNNPNRGRGGRFSGRRGRRGRHQSN